MTSAEPGVLHAYGVVDAASCPRLPAAGLGGAPVFLVAAGPIAAVVSELDVAGFGPDVWRARSEDPEWLGAVAAVHNEVLQQVAEETDVLPLRLPALHRDRAEVERVLREDVDGFEAALAEIAGHVEWGGKIFFAAEQEDGAAQEQPATGRDYLMRKAWQASRRQEALEARQRLVLAAHEELAMASTHAVVNAPQDRALTGRREPMLLNAAYLVPRSGRDEFLALADRVGERLFGHGLVLEVSGPWPAYNFAGRSGHPAAGSAP